MGKWGNGEERKKKLREAGYSYSAVQSIVNALVEGNSLPEEQAIPDFKITGTETMKIEIDLSKYNALEISFNFGGE